MCLAPQSTLQWFRATTCMILPCPGPAASPVSCATIPHLQCHNTGTALLSVARPVHGIGIDMMHNAIISTQLGATSTSECYLWLVRVVSPQGLDQPFLLAALESREAGVDVETLQLAQKQCTLHVVPACMHTYMHVQACNMELINLMSEIDEPLMVCMMSGVAMANSTCRALTRDMVEEDAACVQCNQNS